MPNKNHRHWSHLLRTLAVALALLVAACGGDDESLAPASISIAAPSEGASLTSPVTFDMAPTNFIIEPAGSAREGAGHFHLMIDVPCIPAGETIPADESHFHYGDASTSAEVELEPGEHTVCLQAGDGLHVALDLTDSVSFTVSE